MNGKPTNVIRAVIRRLPPSLKHTIQRTLYLPVSPIAFMATVSLLRSLKILRQPRRAPCEPVRRILVSYPYGNLGDLVLTLPMIEAIHAQWPDAVIDIAARARVADLVVGIPFIGNVYRFPNRDSRIPELTGYLRVFDVLAVYRRLMMHQDYDLAVSPRWGDDPSYGSYLMYLTGAPRRFGYSARVTAGNLALDQVLTDVANGGHHEQEALRILRLLTRTALRTEKPEDEDVITAPIASLRDIANVHARDLDGALLDVIRSKYAVIAPGAMVPRKFWPTESFLSVMQKLQEIDVATCVIVGGKDEAQMCEEMVRHFPGRAVSLAGKTTLPQLVAVVANAALFVGNDSGPGHLAGALGIPTVIVNFFPSSCSEEHPSSAVRFRPCGPHVVIVQPEKPLPPCDPCCAMDAPHCIQQVSVEQVLDAVDSLMPSGNRIPVRLL